MKPKRHLERILNSMMKNLLLKINYRDIELDSEKQQTPQNSLQKQGLIHTKHISSVWLPRKHGERNKRRRKLLIQHLLLKSSRKKKPVDKLNGNIFLFWFETKNENLVFSGTK